MVGQGGGAGWIQGGGLWQLDAAELTADMLGYPLLAMLQALLGLLACVWIIRVSSSDPGYLLPLPPLHAELPEPYLQPPHTVDGLGKKRYHRLSLAARNKHALEMDWCPECNIYKPPGEAVASALLRSRRMSTATPPSRQHCHIAGR